MPTHDPTLPRTAANARAFAPRGWTVETQTRGDLNGDGAADLVFVLLAPDIPGAPLRSNPNDGDPTAYANPRILVVALAHREGGYWIALNSRDFLPPKWAPNGLSEGWMLFQDGSIGASHGRLRIDFEYTRSHRTYTFRWQQAALRLIGYESAGVAGGCMNSLSINFLTHRARMVAGYIDRDEERVLRRNFTRRALLTLEGIGNGEEFDPYGLETRFPLRCPGRE